MAILDAGNRRRVQVVKICGGRGRCEVLLFFAVADEVDESMHSFPLALIVTSFPFLTSMGFTPGPNNILVASSGVNFGFRATIPHMLGITTRVFL